MLKYGWSLQKMTKKINDQLRVIEENRTLRDREMLQIVNVMRNKNLQSADNETIRQVDQLTRALEYLCDVQEYNKRIAKFIRAMLKDLLKKKREIRELKYISEPVDISDFNVNWTWIFLEDDELGNTIF